MGRYRLAFSWVLMLITFTLSAQKKVWNDDTEAATKADTSIIKIGDKYFTKVIRVTYDELKRDTFDQGVESARRQLEQAIQQREFNTRTIEELRNKVEAERAYVKKVKSEMKWLEESERPDRAKVTDDELQKRRDAFRVKEPSIKKN